MTFESFFFGPLSKENCEYFYIVMVLYALFGFILLVSAPGILMSRAHFRFKMNTLASIGSVLLGYYVMRLQYTVCTNAIP